MTILSLAVYWTLLVLVVVPLLNFIAGNSWSDGMLFVYISGMILMIIGGLLWGLSLLLTGVS